MGFQSNQLMRLFRRIRAVEGDMTLRRLQVLLCVYLAGDHGIELQSLSKQLDIAGGNLTKLVQSWSTRTSKREKGPDYMRAEPLPDNLSTKVVTMTEKGYRAVEVLLKG